MSWRQEEYVIVGCLIYLSYWLSAYILVTLLQCIGQFRDYRRKIDPLVVDVLESQPSNTLVSITIACNNFKPTEYDQDDLLISFGTQRVIGGPKRFSNFIQTVIPVGNVPAIASLYWVSAISLTAAS